MKRFNNGGNKKFDRVNFAFKAFWVFFVVVFVAVIAWYVFMGVLLFKTAEQIEEHGAKSVVSDIWCGKGKDCL